mmetsp:Transcript_9530/g.27456  ORF Transcript_9530/g.27456 Transcript_9530/m.27456 type:complete len:225 (+) Transcript_9530:1578-2252(+)
MTIKREPPARMIGCPPQKRASLVTASSIATLLSRKLHRRLAREHRRDAHQIIRLVIQVERCSDLLHHTCIDAVLARWAAVHHNQHLRVPHKNTVRKRSSRPVEGRSVSLRQGRDILLERHGIAGRLQRHPLSPGKQPRHGKHAVPRLHPTGGEKHVWRENGTGRRASEPRCEVRVSRPRLPATPMTPLRARSTPLNHAHREVGRVGRPRPLCGMDIHCLVPVSA